jgi:mannose-6-phosphate isomerase-like protein (cupin superfamily)
MPIDIITHKGVKNSRVIISPTVRDIRLVENLHVRKNQKKSPDMWKVVISKPWGAEYLCGRNKYLEVWELYIEPESSTSLHCHPEKDTLNIVLDGRITLETMDKKEVLSAGEFRLIKAGAIHKTINRDRTTIARVLEIESPPNKYDLIRIQDAYGRESLGYVTIQLKDPLKEKLMIRHCLTAGYVPRSIHAREFMGDYSLSGERNKHVRVSEVFLDAVAFDTSKNQFLRYIEAYSMRNMMVMDGALALTRGKKCIKFLPGDCITHTNLHEYNWSANKANIFLW